MSKADDTAERIAVGCVGLVTLGLAIGWLVFLGWMIYEVVTWLTQK